MVLVQSRIARKHFLRQVLRAVGVAVRPASNVAQGNIVTSCYGEVPLPPAGVPYPDYVLRNALSYGNKTALIDGESGRSYSYQDLQASVQQLSAGLTDIGLQKGDVLALFSPNVPEYVIAFHGTSSIGGVVTTANPQYTVHELTRQLIHSNAKYLLTHPTLVDKALLAADNAGVKNIFVFGGSDVGRFQSFESLLKKNVSHTTVPPLDTKNDLLVLPYSSGTTGLPKGVMLTHDNLKVNVAQGMVTPLWNFSPDSVILAMLPLYHIYGMIFFTGYGPSCGFTTVTMSKFTLESFLDYIQKYKVTTIPLVPPVAIQLAKEPLVDEYDVSSLTEIICAAAPLGKELTDELHERFPHLKVLRQAYGLTETSPLTHLAPWDKPVDGSIGKIIPNTKCKVIDVSTGDCLGPREDGEICIHGPQIMKGYLKNPEATAATVDAEGWLHTGDIGHYDEEGNFFIVDRIKELIKYKGNQVAPAELEAVILGHHQVADVAVVGVKDLESGELPRAFVVPHGDVTESDIQDFVAERVAPYKKLRGGVEFVESIPKSPSGKILRRFLRDQVNGK